MEIQDRNSIMQLALNLNFDSKNLSSASEIGFIDMIKNSSLDNNVKTPDFDVSKDVNNLISEKSKISRPAAQKNTDFSAEKTQNKAPVKSAAKTTKKNTAQTSAREDDSLPVNSGISQDKAQVQPSQDETSAPAENNVENTDCDITDDVSATSDNNELKIAENLWTLGDVFDLSAPTAAPMQQDEVVANDADMTMEVAQNTTSDNTATTIEKVLPQTVAMTSEITEDSAPHKRITTEQNNNLPNMALTENDDLLIHQAQQLDKQIGSSHHLKIDVSVNEAKIAAPIENNILQNSFALTSMLQSDNPIDAQANFENVIENEQILTNTDTAQNNTDTQTLAVNNNFVANFSGQNSSLTSPEDVAVINSIQSVELSASHMAPKNEFSPRLMETKNDTALKGLGKEVIEQIKVNITKSAVKGVDTIDIELKPEELGKVQVRMYISKDGKLHADIIATRQETSDLLQREVESLSKSFQDAGYDTGKQNFNFSSQEERQANHNREENKLQQFIGETLAQENEPTGVNDNLAYDPKAGLNIRV